MNKRFTRLFSIFFIISIILSSITSYVSADEISDITDNTNNVIEFIKKDGSIIASDESGNFHLNTLDEGKFRIKGYQPVNSDDLPYWSAVVSMKENGRNYENVWVYSDGTYQGYDKRTVEARVYSKDPIYNDSVLLKKFIINNSKSDIEEIKVFVDGNEVSLENPVILVGRETKKVNVKARRSGQNDFFDLKSSMLKFKPKSNENFFTIDGSFRLSPKSNGRGEFLVEVVDGSAKASFLAIEENTRVQSFYIDYPDTFYISDYDGLGNNFIGVTPSVYSVEFTPENPSNKTLIWENLEPDIAYFEEKFGKGIVPKKAGMARFLVTSADNPNLTQDVEIEFFYKKPITSVDIIKENYVISEGETVDLDILITPEDATMQLFDWEYSLDGIVNVNSKISRNNLNETHKFSHKLTGIKAGIVSVTGRAKDTNLDKSISFQVEVLKKDSIDRDYIKLSKEHEEYAKSNLLNKNSLNFGNEWNLITLATLGKKMSNSDIDIYINNAYSDIESNLSSPTTTARIILALTANGKDAKDVKGLNLIDSLMNNENIDKGTSNNSIFALIALDSNNYDVPRDSVWNREKLIDKILSFQNEDGGFALFDNGKTNIDITGMALQSLAKYKDETKVRNAIDKSLIFLSSKQESNGGYGNNSPTTAQVLIALSSLGIDASKDDRFIKNSKNLLDFLDKTKSEGGYSIEADGSESNSFSNYQIPQAFTSFLDNLEKNKRYFDFTKLNTDIDDNGSDIDEDNEVDFSDIYDFIDKLEQMQNIELPREKEQVLKARKDYDRYHKNAPEEYIEDLEGGVYWLRILEVKLSVIEHRNSLDLADNEEANTEINNLKTDIKILLENDELSTRDLTDKIGKLEEKYIVKLDEIKEKNGYDENEFDFSEIMDLIDLADSVLNPSLPEDMEQIKEIRKKYDELVKKTPTEYIEDLENALVPLITAESKLSIYEQIKTLNLSSNLKEKADDIYIRYGVEVSKILDEDLSKADTIEKIIDKRNEYKDMVKNLKYANSVDIAKKVLGNIYISVEKFSIGQGSIIHPTKIELLEGENTSHLVTRIFNKNGFQIRNAGDVDNDFYLSAIKDENGSLIASFPEHILKSMREEGINVSNERENNWLGEFDYTNMSGWVFSVNNIHSPVGMSNARLKDGDVIRLAFTVVGYGKDVWETGYGSYLTNNVDKSELIRTIGNFKASEYFNTLKSNKTLMKQYNELNKILSSFEYNQEEIDKAIENFEKIRKINGDNEDDAIKDDDNVKSDLNKEKSDLKEKKKTDNNLEVKSKQHKEDINKVIGILEIKNNNKMKSSVKTNDNTVGTQELILLIILATACGGFFNKRGYKKNHK